MFLALVKALLTDNYYMRANIVVKILCYVVFAASAAPVFSQVPKNTCQQDEEKIKTRIETLKVQNICSMGANLKECRDLLVVDSEVKLPEGVKIEGVTADVENMANCPIPPLGTNYIPPVLGIVAYDVTARVVPTLNASITQASEHIKGLEDFYRHTMLHKKRVVALGLHLYDQNPEMFKGLSREMLEKALSAHDNAKVLPQYRDSKNRPFYQALYEDGFGRRPPQQLVDDLNKADAKIMEETLDSMGLSLDDSKIATLSNLADMNEKIKRRKLRKMISYIEKMADFADRGMSNISPEEFGRAMDKASDFMKNPADAELVKKQLEENYDEIVEGLEYENLTDGERKIIKRRLILAENTYRANAQPQWLRKLSANARVAAFRTQGNQFYRRGASMAKRGYNNLAAKIFGKPIAVEVAIAGLAPSTIGCGTHISELDYEQRGGRCQPIEEMTEKFLGVLYSEDEKVKDDQLEMGDFCSTFEKIYEKAVLDNPEDTVCREGYFTMRVNGVDPISVVHENKDIKSFHMTGNSTSFEMTPMGRVEELQIGHNGELSGICFEKPVRGIKIEKTCMDLSEIRRSRYVDDLIIKQATAFIQAVNFKTNKVLACCLGENSDVVNADSCQTVNRAGVEGILGMK